MDANATNTVPFFSMNTVSLACYNSNLMIFDSHFNIINVFRAQKNSDTLSFINSTLLLQPMGKTHICYQMT